MIKSAIITVSIYRDADSPIFGENTTHISVDDEGGGPFINIHQWYNGNDEKIRLDLDELKEIFRISKKIIKGIESAKT